LILCGGGETYKKWKRNLRRKEPSETKENEARVREKKTRTGRLCLQVEQCVPGLSKRGRKAHIL